MNMNLFMTLTICTWALFCLGSFVDRDYSRFMYSIDNAPKHRGQELNTEQKSWSEVDRLME